MYPPGSPAEPVIPVTGSTSASSIQTAVSNKLQNMVAGQYTQSFRVLNRLGHKQYIFVQAKLVQMLPEVTSFQNSKNSSGSGGIRTHASEETGA